MDARQYNHLHPVTYQALQQCGIANASLCFISDTGNIIFRAETAQANYAVRIYPEKARTINEIEGELYWLRDLNENSSLTIPNPIESIQGELVQLVDLPNDDPSYQVVIFHWLPGEVIGDALTAEIAQEMGRQMGELHKHSATFKLTNGRFRDTTDWQAMQQFTANLKPIQFARINTLLSPPEQAICHEAAQQVALVLNQIETSHHFGLIHSDLHTHNCLLHQGKVSLIDFEDCQYSPFTGDLAITLNSFINCSDYLLLKEKLLRGYTQILSLPSDAEKQINAFMVERALRLIRWVST
ncbi:MAG: phosphotransferase [Anaerolineales bacterium]|nr:phosphotransferase [Anaerolineales bacterium]